jgi:MFS family permease
MCGVRVLRVLIAIGIGVALADASIVTLALPELLIDLDTGVEGVAAVIGVYTLALAIALPLAALARRALPDPALGAAGFAVFAVAGGFCAAADTLTSMLVFRTLQALGASAALVGGFGLLRGGRLWIAAAVFGTAVGPALGGALTQAFDWRAIFEFQVPVALVAAVAAAAWAALPRLARDAGAAPEGGADAGGPLWAGAAAEAETARAEEARASRADTAVVFGRPGAWVALAALSAALTGVLFLLVLLLVSGWSLDPLTAALAVSVLPLAAVAGERIPGAPAIRASAGCALVGGGVLALAVLPAAEVAWIILPQVLAGAGMGMALPALAGELLPEKTPGQAARLLSFRHAGITIALLILAPIAAGQLDATISDVREQGAALVLDARLPPLDKVEMAGPLVADLDPTDARDGLRRALDGQAHRFAGDAEDKAEFARLTERADDVLVSAIDDAFSTAFLITGALALLGAVAVLPRRPRALAVTAAVAAAALALPAFHAIVRPQVEPEPVVIADPCEERALPDTGGITGFLQDRALDLLDGAACRFGSSREALVLALADEGDARAYQAKYGVDPRSTRGILEGVGINLP